MRQKRPASSTGSAIATRRSRQRIAAPGPAPSWGHRRAISNGPATLTGSIGVLAGKLVVAHLLNKIGVTTDSAERGANSGMFSTLRDFSPAERQRLDTFLDLTYRGFKEHVAAGRHLSADEVEAVAKGRVWSGEEAKAKG